MSTGGAEERVERALFASRWLMAPFYLLMVIALGGLLALMDWITARATKA